MLHFRPLSYPLAAVLRDVRHIVICCTPAQLVAQSARSNLQARRCASVKCIQLGSWHPRLRRGPGRAVEPDHPRTCARSSRKGRTPRPIPDRGRDADDNHFLAPVAAALLLVLVGAPYAPHGVPTTYGSMPDPTLAAFMGTLGSLHLFLGMLAIASAPLAAGICGPATLTTSRY